MKNLNSLYSNINAVKKPLRHIKKIKHVRWLLPGWAFYEYYKLSQERGHTRGKSLSQGAKAEVIRLATTVSLPIPGTYELTTTGLALLKNKIVKGEVDNLTFKSLKDFIPVKINKEEFYTGKHFEIFYKEGKPYLRMFFRKR